LVVACVYFQLNYEGQAQTIHYWVVTSPIAATLECIWIQKTVDIWCMTRPGIEPALY
jgi:hypothetical protein